MLVDERKAQPLQKFEDEDHDKNATIVIHFLLSSSFVDIVHL